MLAARRLHAPVDMGRVVAAPLSLLLIASCAVGEVADEEYLDEIELAGCQRHLEVTYDSAAQLSGGQLTVQEARTDSVRVITESNGNRAVRSELAYGDPQVAGGPRAETQASGNGGFRYERGDRFYYGFRVYLPAGWTDDGGNEDILFQWHNIPDVELGEASKSPNIFLAVKRTELVLRVTSDARQVSTSTSPLKVQYPVVTFDPTRAQWHDLVVAVDWSYVTGEGRVRVWHKLKGQSSYVKVVDKLGPNMHNDLQPGYLKWGIYKPSWRSGATAVGRRVVMHDQIRVGLSFDEVRPEQAPCQ